MCAVSGRISQKRAHGRKTATLFSFLSKFRGLISLCRLRSGCAEDPVCLLKLVSYTLQGQGIRHKPFVSKKKNSLLSVWATLNLRWGDSDPPCRRLRSSAKVPALDGRRLWITLRWVSLKPRKPSRHPSRPKNNRGSSRANNRQAHERDDDRRAVARPAPHRRFLRLRYFRRQSEGRSGVDGTPDLFAEHAA